MDCPAHIAADHEVMHGAVCCRGTRIPVSVVFDNLADGLARAEILQQYPSLTPELIPAALAHAAGLALDSIVRMSA